MSHHDHHGHALGARDVGDSFPRDTTGLPTATSPETVNLRDGDVFELRALPVRKRIGGAMIRMLGYNGSIPGPTLKVVQGSEVTVDFTNETDLETTVHWHGLRLDNRFDGVPEGAHHGMQPPIAPGGSFGYRLSFPDPGVYWYHPHVREDYTQEMGLYGNIVVVPSDPDYWSPVNREITLMLDDILIEDGDVAPFSRTESNRTAMGRFGNVMLTNGALDLLVEASRGEVVRLYLTNTANVRTFNFRIPGARMKLVGRDNGRVEHEEFGEETLIAPSERVIMDVLFDGAGEFALEHRTPDRAYSLGTARVSERPVERSYEREFSTLRHSEELAAERERLEVDFDRPPDKTLALVGEMPGMGHHGDHGHPHHGEHAEVDPVIEWEDTMPMMNELSTPRNMHWKLIDRETGDANHDIRWSFGVGDRVKVRIVNEPDSDHPMQHPIHFHGQRFLVLARDGVRNPNLAWKDTNLVSTGQTTDILVEMSNPGTWMVHCHIAEHLEGGMMFSFEVEE
ncbi:MAG: multicopper oxidase family protein [Actinomycetota bacterium]|nr:multicopper oxidase family protein [Actinomycetota bacterium]